MQYAMFLVMRDIRGKAPELLANAAASALDEETRRSRATTASGLHGMNGRQIHRLLARMTDYIETRSGMPSRYAEYVQRGGQERLRDRAHLGRPSRAPRGRVRAIPSDFAEYRNRIGGLLLLPKSFNASYGDLPYAEKREHYDGQNLLARSLHPQAYDHNPGFLRFIQEQSLPFAATRSSSRPT